jgi:UDP-2,3-diacylglucosamine hydrolase
MPPRAGLKLGLIAGGGELPVALAEACTASGRPLLVLRLRGFAGPDLARFPGVEVGIAELGRTFDLLRREGCEAVCFAGQVKRPDFSALKPDLRGLRSLPAAIAAARRGDDALLRFLVEEFEREGFTVEGADQVHAGLTLPKGPLGRHAPSPEHAADLDQALAAAKAIGALDIGQAVVVAGGVVLAVEAQEGTDAMLARCLTLPLPLRGTAHDRRGVLVKWPKPIQERRTDLPVLGPATVEGAAAAGLAGIAGEAGGLLVLQRDAVIDAADRLGLFVVGL